MSEIIGTSGNDTIMEGSGYSGGAPSAGNDTITGNGGHDVIAGGNGNDRIIGDTAQLMFVATNSPFAGIDVGMYSAPSFTDLDDDGDLDLVVGGYSGRLLAWRREANGSYTAMDGASGRPANPVAGVFVGRASTPSFTDLDGDGDLDLVVGASFGGLRAYRRETNGTYLEMYAAPGRPDNPFAGIDVGSYSAPSFTDLDGDGDLDLVVGETGGTLLTWRREANGSYTAMDGASGRPSNPFAGPIWTIRMRYGSSTPSFTDLDGDGDLDLVVGERLGTLSPWRREADGSFTPMDGLAGRPANPFAGIGVGRGSAPSFNDLDGDGAAEFVVGSDTGSLQFFAPVVGNDSILGGLGDDTLAGGWGRDTLAGASGLNTLDGGADNDSLLGGGDADALMGAAGNEPPRFCRRLQLPNRMEPL